MKKKEEIVHYQSVLHKTEKLILGAQEQFIKDATRTSIELYWEIGKLLSQVGEKYQWGQQIIAQLSRDLYHLFSNARGYSEQNLRRMRQFYYEYKESPELLALTKKVRWSTNIAIFHKVKSAEARKFYLQMAIDSMCGRDIIEMQIKSQAYERECLHDKKHNFELTLPAQLSL